MERLQIILLMFISSSWFLTCRNEQLVNMEKETGTVETLIADSTGIKMNSTDFYSEWLSLPFSGSGSNWMATIAATEIPESVLIQQELSVYMKKSGLVFKLDYRGDEGNIDHIIDHGVIRISAGFNPENTEFRYVISRDGTFVKQNIADLNYTAKLK